MRQESGVKPVRRLCPCDPCDVEGIQSWLEDMAAEGLFLVKDGAFGGIFSFERKPPQTATYRLDVARKRKSHFGDAEDAPTAEEVELYRSMGWEYLLRYGDFCVYRAAEPDAPELNTETEIHAITMRLMKKKYRISFIRTVLTTLFWLLCTQWFLRYGFRTAALIGPVFTICIYSVVLLDILGPLRNAARFRRYEKRLSQGDCLNRRTEWRKCAPIHICMRALPGLLFCIAIVGLLCAYIRMSDELSNNAYPGDPPFATVADMFPDGTISEENTWLDYGTFKTAKNAVSKYVEWNESCDVTAADGVHYSCVLRISYHETISEWFARGLEKDYYNYDASRYFGKHFEALAAPTIGVDSIRVYLNYGTLCVLMREGNSVVHAFVIADNPDNQNDWQLWAQAMAEILDRSATSSQEAAP